MYKDLLFIVEDKTEGGQTRPLSHLGGASPHQSPTLGGAAILHSAAAGTPNSLQQSHHHPQLYNSTNNSRGGGVHHINKHHNNMVHNISQPVDQLAYG